nr:formin-2 isoform X2 [Ipomoea batatas]GMD16059.1 formin-2 isoform X2 [Ipomoea batatas]
MHVGCVLSGFNLIVWCFRSKTSSSFCSCCWHYLLPYCFHQSFSDASRFISGAVMCGGFSGDGYVLKERKEGSHVFSAGVFTFRPLKQPKLCNRKTKKNVADSRPVAVKSATHSDSGRSEKWPKGSRKHWQNICWSN